MPTQTQMKNKLNAYWKKRQKQAEKAKMHDMRLIEREMGLIYQRTLKDIETQINAFYTNYATREGISKQEAKRRVDAMDVKAFEDKARRYVAERNFSDKANEELKVYNLTMRVNRLELLQYNIDLEMVALGSDEYNLTKRIKSEAFLKEIKDQAGILGLSTASQQKLNQTLQAVLNKPYYGATFSTRIWDRVENLRLWAEFDMPKYILQGKNPRDMIKELQEIFGVTEFEAERLAITEYGYIQTEAQKVSYEEADMEMYDLMPESTACDVCVEVANNNPYKVSEMVEGENAPMLHPYCKCGTAPHPDREGLEQMFQDLGL